MKIFMTQGNDHQRPLPAEKASKSKVDKVTHAVAVVIFLPQPPCCSVHGPMYKVATVAELVTTTGISPPMTLKTAAVSTYLAISRGQTLCPG